MLLLLHDCEVRQDGPRTSLADGASIKSKMADLTVMTGLWQCHEVQLRQAVEFERVPRSTVYQRDAIYRERGEMRVLVCARSRASG